MTPLEIVVRRCKLDITPTATLLDSSVRRYAELLGHGQTRRVIRDTHLCTMTR